MPYDPDYDGRSPPEVCSGCSHEFDHDSRPSNPHTGRCTTCDPHYCYRCQDVVVERDEQACAACSGSTCERCEDAASYPGLPTCSGCAEVQADSLAADLHQIGVDLADAQALVARLTAEAEGTRATRQRILDALASTEEVGHAA